MKVTINFIHYVQIYFYEILKNTILSVKIK